MSAQYLLRSCSIFWALWADISCMRLISVTYIQIVFRDQIRWINLGWCGANVQCGAVLKPSVVPTGKQLIRISEPGDECT